MTYHPDLPWPQIHEYLLGIEATDQLKSFSQQAVLDLKQLIPYETAYILFFDDGFQVADYQVFGVPDKQIRDFLDYYITIDPCRQTTSPDAKFWRLDWNEFRHTEFQTDFGRSANIFHTVSMYLHNPKQMPGAIFFMTRPAGRGFTDHDFAVWEVIQPHLSNHFSMTEKLRLIRQPALKTPDDKTQSPGFIRNPSEFHPIELLPGHKLLSKREAEVAALLCQRFTVPEIATRLMISPHTVRCYMDNIKEKLNIKNRRELVVKMTVER